MDVNEAGERLISALARMSDDDRAKMLDSAAAQFHAIYHRRWDVLADVMYNQSRVLVALAGAAGISRDDFGKLGIEALRALPPDQE